VDGNLGAVTADRFAGWIPIRVTWREGEPVVHWFRLGEMRFDDAYFADTIARCARRQFNLAFRRETPIDVLGEIAEARPGLPPAGFLFHTSRCGSTLVSRLLSSLPDTLVIAEASPIDNVLRANLNDPSISDDDRVRWLRWIINALAQAQDGVQRRCVIKLDAWHTAHLAIFERAFPNVPWVYLYRDPLEVLVSHMITNSFMMAAANAPALLGMPVTEAVHIPREQYCARALARISESVLERGVRPDQLVTHGELPDAVWKRIAPRFDLALSNAQIEMMRQATSFHAKRPGELYVDDRATKQHFASAELRAAADEYLSHIYRRLETVRCTANGGACGN
jgi:gluconate kinase